MNYLFIELLTANDEGIERESEREQTSKIVPYLPHTHTPRILSRVHRITSDNALAAHNTPNL